MFMNRELFISLKRGRSRQLAARFLNRSATGGLNSAKAIGSDTAHAILRIQASSAPNSLYPSITSGLNIYFTQSTKKSQNPSKAWMGCIRWSDCRE